jgi:hypothetical protein
MRPLRLPSRSPTRTGQPADPSMDRCVLCGLPRERVGKLILGMHGGICHACVRRCAEILRTEGGQKESSGGAHESS